MSRRIVCGLAIGLAVSTVRAESGPVACDPDLLAAEAEMRESSTGSPAAPSGSPFCAASCVSAAHILLYEDTAGVMVDPLSSHQDEVLLKVRAANQLIGLYGDRFDFIGFWTSFNPSTRVGGANFRHIRNSDTGFGLGLIDDRAALGLASERVQGFVTMYDLHLTANWDLNVTLDHEIGHRWLVFMNSLADGRLMRNGAHAQCALDDQGGMHGTEWAGVTAPRVRSAADNVDTSVTWGWLQLYLMGYADPVEAQAGMSEQRYMDEAVGVCPASYDGPISTWTIPDLIDTNGVRTPGADASQKHYRAGWVLIHQPGAPPSARELDGLAALLTGYCDHWVSSTLGRGSMTQTLFPDCSCSGIPAGACVECTVDTECDDGRFCDGLETCDAGGGACRPGAPPCLATEICNEEMDVCQGCRDADGDGYGLPASVFCREPAESDCDDTEPDTFPRAPEVNDGLDNQCPGDRGYGLIDEISGLAGFYDPAHSDTLSWPPQRDAGLYDVFRLPRPALAGDCTTVTVADALWSDASRLAPGGTLQYLVRASAPFAGSWGEDSAGLERSPRCP